MHLVACSVPCCLDPLVVPIYVGLSLIAPLALTNWWFWKELASHGKTMMGTTKHQRTPSERLKNHPQDDGDDSSWLARVISDIVLRNGWFWVPKRYFTHFYFVGMVNLSLCVYCSSSMVNLQSTSNVILLSLLMLHLLRRWIECLMVHAWNEGSRMHLGGYCLGMLHYLLLPLVFLDVSCDGVTADKTVTDEAAHSSLSLTVGSMALLCVWAQYQQHRHHCILAGLRDRRRRRGTRKPCSNNQTVSDYAIPSGGWFQWVSCPHYLAEILIYLTWTLLMTETTTAPRRRRHWILLVWVADNLTVSAISSHKWYIKNYPNKYSKLNRRAILPGIL